MTYSIGIDIGGTRIAIAAVSADYRILVRHEMPTEAEKGFDRTVARIADAMTSLRQPGEGASAIGIGCAGPVDSRSGMINNPYTLGGWNRCDIVTPLRERFGVPVYLENDADAAAFGECLAGAGRGFDPVVMLTFGTGVGGAAVVDGRIYRGASGEHPEIGHILVAPDGPKCYCGAGGCLESIASGTAIGESGRQCGLPDARAVLAAANQGNPQARAILDRALAAAQSAAFTLLHTFLPQRLILGGGVMESAYGLFAAAVQRGIDAATMIPRGVTVANAALANDAGLLGAAGWALLQQQTHGGRCPPSSEPQGRTPCR